MITHDPEIVDQVIEQLEAGDGVTVIRDQVSCFSYCAGVLNALAQEARDNDDFKAAEALDFSKEICLGEVHRIAGKATGKEE